MVVRVRWYASSCTNLASGERHPDDIIITVPVSTPVEESFKIGLVKVLVKDTFSCHLRRTTEILPLREIHIFIPNAWEPCLLTYKLPRKQPSKGQNLLTWSQDHGRVHDACQWSFERSAIEGVHILGLQRSATAFPNNSQCLHPRLAVMSKRPPNAAHGLHHSTSHNHDHQSSLYT